jgi:carbonic anhydrase/acetyltransferase-like protein (isoleucine patch superfamily)
MNLYSFKEYIPKIGKNCFLAPGSIVIGNIILEENANIWFNTVLRGDVNQIHIGKDTNIQDLSMLHVTEKNPLIIKENVTVGHSVTLHGCTIEKNCLIGMGATVLDKSVIGEYSIVAAGSVVSPNKIFPAKSMIMGVPAKVVRQLNEEEIKMLNTHFKSYLKYANEFMDEEVLIPIKS